MATSDEIWLKLVDAVRANDCVVLLGPRAVSYGNNTFYDLLIERFKDEIKKRGGKIDPSERKLSRIVHQFKATFGSLHTEALNQLGKTLEVFYHPFLANEIPIYQQLSALRIKYIINTTPDDLLEKALRTKWDCHFFYFDVKHPEHNAKNNEKVKEIERKGDSDAFWIYNFLGHYSRPKSLVLTDLDQLRFLKFIIQNTRDSVLSKILNSESAKVEKTYLFLGFDFKDWHLKMLLPQLGLGRGDEEEPFSVSSQSSDELDQDTRAFYDETLRLFFVGNESASFLAQLQEKLAKPKQTSPIEIMLFYDEDDAHFGDEIEHNLKVITNRDRDRKIEIWHQNKLFAGANVQAEMMQRTEKATIFIPLITTNLLANMDNRTYLNLALSRHKKREASVVGLYMTPCAIKYFPNREDIAIYPNLPEKALSLFNGDRQNVIVQFVKEIDKLIDDL